MNDARSKSPLPDVGLLLIRLALAAVFLYHGSGKLFGAFGGSGMTGWTETVNNMGIPMPTVGAWAAALAEFAGGLAMLTGVLFRPLALGLVATMLVAIFAVHWPAFNAAEGGFEYPMTLCLAALGLLLTGPGKFAITLKKGK